MFGPSKYLLRGVINALNERIVALKAERDGLASGKDWWRDEADRLNERLVEVTAERDRVAAELDDCNRVCNTKGVIISNQRAENDTLKAELAWEKEGNKQLSECIAEFSEKCDKLEQITRQARGEYSDAKGTIHKLQAEVDALRAELASQPPLTCSCPGPRTFYDHDGLMTCVRCRGLITLKAT